MDDEEFGSVEHREKNEIDSPLASMGMGMFTYDSLFVEFYGINVKGKHIPKMYHSHGTYIQFDFYGKLVSKHTIVPWMRHGIYTYSISVDLDRKHILILNVYSIPGPSKGCQIVPHYRVSIHHPLGFQHGTPTGRC